MKKIILMLIAAILLTSCGARKTNKSNTMVSESTEVMMMTSDTTGVTTDIQTNTVTEVDTDTEEVTITPIDSSKEMNVDGKKYTNVIISSKKDKSKKKVTNKDIIKKDSLAVNSETSIKVDVKKAIIEAKTTERTEPITFYIYVFLFILLIILLYSARNKIKSLFL